MSELFTLQAPYQPAGDQVQAIEKLVAGVKRGDHEQTLLGVTGSGKTFTMANVIAQMQRPTMIMSHNKTLAAQLYGEMKSFFPNNAVEFFISYYDYYQPEAYLPVTDTYLAKTSSINDQIDQMRLAATKALLTRRDTICVCSVSAIFGLGEPENYVKMLVHLREGQTIAMDDLLNKLVALRYDRKDDIYERGTFHVRGESIDVFPSESAAEGLRIEFFDDEIERLSLIDPISNHVLARVPNYVIFPKNHFVTPRDVILKAVEEIKAELKQQVAYFESAGKIVEAQRLRERTEYDIALLLECGFCPGIENYSRFFTERKPGDVPACLFNYLPKDGLLMIDESHVTVPQIGAMYRGDLSRKTNLVDYGFRLPSAYDNRPLKFEEFVEMQPQTIYISATPAEYEHEHSSQIVEQVLRPTGLLDPLIEVRPAETQVDDLMEEIKQRAAKNERVLVTVLTKHMAEELTEFLSTNDIRVRYMHADIDNVERMAIIKDLRLGEFDVLVGINLLREGLDIPEVSLVAILDADKQGFLRSTRSLIQTVGRAARNVHGMAIFYADKETDAIKQTIAETARRRQIQDQWNKEHGIVPQQITKKVVDVMDMALESSAGFKVPDEPRPQIQSRQSWEAAHGIDSLHGAKQSGRQKEQPILAKDVTVRLERSVSGLKKKKEAKGLDVDAMSIRQLKMKKSALIGKMGKLAEEMKFEEAAVVRDQVMLLDKALRERMI